MDPIYSQWVNGSGVDQKSFWRRYKSVIQIPCDLRFGESTVDWADKTNNNSLYYLQILSNPYDGFFDSFKANETSCWWLDFGPLSGCTYGQNKKWKGNSSKSLTFYCALNNMRTLKFKIHLAMAFCVTVNHNYDHKQRTLKHKNTPRRIEIHRSAITQHEL